jgi:hypothetical protein
VDPKLRWIRPRKVLAPLASRHRLSALSHRTRVKVVNSVAMPWVDMVADTAAIRRGDAEPLDNDRWRVNGRIYAREGNANGRLYPESGDGIVVLRRAEFRALLILNRYNGDMVRCMREFDSNPEMGEEEIDIALRMYALGKGEDA